MSCCFCKSDFHVSQNCDIYATDESRKEILKAHEFCDLSLLKFQDDEKQSKICYACFSDDHLKEFCPERIHLSKPFLPAIVGDLLSRFMKTLNAIEIYLLVFSSPKAFKFATRKLVKIKKSVTLPGPFDESGITVVSDSLHLSDYCAINKNTEIALRKILICNAKKIELHGAQISAQDFFYFLSPKVVSLDCYYLKLDKIVELGEVLHRIPNFKKVGFVKSDVKIENSWMTEFGKYSNKEKCERFEIDLKYCDLNVAQLAEMMKTKCNESIEIILNICDYPEFERHRRTTELKNKILEEFGVYNRRWHPEKQKLKIGIWDQDQCGGVGTFTQKFTT